MYKVNLTLIKCGVFINYGNNYQTVDSEFAPRCQFTSVHCVSKLMIKVSCWGTAGKFLNNTRRTMRRDKLVFGNRGRPFLHAPSFCNSIITQYNFLFLFLMSTLLLLSYFLLCYTLSFLYYLQWESAQRSRYTDEAVGWTTEEFCGGSRKGQEMFSPPQHPYRFRGIPSYPFNWFRGSSPKVKRPGREVDHSPPLTLVTRLRMSGPINIFTLHSFMSWTRIRSPFYVPLLLSVTYLVSTLHNSCTAHVLPSYQVCPMYSTL